MSETVTVHVWQGGRLDSYDELLERDPDVYEVPIAETEFGKVWEVGDDERVMLAESIDHHGTYAFDVPTDERPATLNVHTNDSYHDREDWGDPVERGLEYREGDDYEPYQCEMWGRIMMWVDRPGESE
ncbi:hypothetical protein Htur_5060 (plasmid) [Haloterrigena turkmenica DSM 5511]|uniref:Uncharacterized protein n=1 Tax=Haloterrigena turkmenica (strain ATCC 51198 / DSM 5511 / JCM 9101 / NCIMB 13204 / VKM B-1734 / 4k) TaxID=543526 RepID=D2S3K0_HALTV|nr:hypothetical protein [Haloterrigena turkmenica]ADB63947.1 hypothetical protein Htur_5060 [Haloterrigena turkmenica DSM 5511]